MMACLHKLQWKACLLRWLWSDTQVIRVLPWQSSIC